MLSCIFNSVPVETCSIKKKSDQSTTKLLLGTGEGKYFYGPVLVLALMQTEGLTTFYLFLEFKSSGNGPEGLVGIRGYNSP